MIAFEHNLLHLAVVLLTSDAVLALVGGVGFAGTRLSTALWGGREITDRARKHAVAQFILSLILAPAAGFALTPLAHDTWPKATREALSLLIGLMFNATWPLLVKPAFLRTLLADLFRGLAARLSGEPS